MSATSLATPPWTNFQVPALRTKKLVGDSQWMLEAGDNVGWYGLPALWPMRWVNGMLFWVFRKYRSSPLARTSLALYEATVSTLTVCVRLRLAEVCWPLLMVSVLADCRSPAVAVTVYVPGSRRVCWLPWPIVSASWPARLTVMLALESDTCRSRIPVPLRLTTAAIRTQTAIKAAMTQTAMAMARSGSRVAGSCPSLP